MEALTTAVREGCVSGEVGCINTSAVRVEDLDKAIELAARLGVKTDSAAVALAGARIARKIRQAVLGEDWGAVDEVVYAAGDDLALMGVATGTAASMTDLNVGAELQLVQGELEDKVMRAELLEGVRRGCLIGDVGTMDLTRIDPTTFDMGIGFADKFGCINLRTKRLLAAARVLRGLRAAAQKGDLKKMAALITDAEEGDAVRLCSHAQPEMSRFKIELKYQLSLRELTEAASTTDETRLYNAVRNFAVWEKGSREENMGGLRGLGGGGVVSAVDRGDRGGHDEPQGGFTVMKRTFMPMTPGTKKMNQWGMRADAEDGTFPTLAAAALYASASATHNKLVEAKAMLTAALRTGAERALVESILFCEKHNYTSPLCQRARHMVTAIDALKEKTVRACCTPNKAYMEAMLTELEANYLNIPEMRTIGGVMKLQWDDFLHECLRRAKRTEDFENGARAMLAQADRTFVDANNPNDERMHKDAPFNLLRFEGVKTTKQFARRFGVSSRELRSGMFTYSDITLHTPLSSSSNITQGDAIVLSTLILGFTGTRQPKKGTGMCI